MNYLTKARQLFKRKQYDDCLSLLYDNTTKAKQYVWGLVLLSFALDALSFYLTYVAVNTHSAVIAVIAVIAAVIAGLAGIAAGLAVFAGSVRSRLAGIVGITAGLAGIAVFAAGLAAGLAAGSAVIAVGFAAGSAVFAVGFAASDHITKWACKRVLGMTKTISSIRKWVNGEEKRLVLRLGEMNVPNVNASIQGSLITIRKIKEYLR